MRLLNDLKVVADFLLYFDMPYMPVSAENYVLL